MSGDKSWSGGGDGEGDAGGCQGVLRPSGGREAEALLRRSFEDDETVDEFQCEQGEGAQLERLPPSPLLPSRQVRPRVALQSSFLQVTLAHSRHGSEKLGSRYPPIH